MGILALLITLCCSSNNFSETVLNCFLEAVCEYGIRSHMHTDHGSENALIWEFMEKQYLEVDILLAKLYTTLVLKGYGGMFTDLYLHHMLPSFMILNMRELLTQLMKLIYLPFIMNFYPGYCH